MILRRALLASALGGVLVASTACPEDDLMPFDELVDACIRASACGFKAYPRVGNCVTNYYDRIVPFGETGAWNTIYECVNGKGGKCAEIAKCFGTTVGAGTCDRNFKAACQGSTATSCDLLDDRVYKLDCDAAGLACAVSSNPFSARCTPSQCKTATFNRKCVDGRLQSCANGVVEIEDCGRRGLGCGTQDGIASCIGTGGACDNGAHTPTCDGSVVVLCVGGKKQRKDCASNSVTRACKAGLCVVSGSQCSADAVNTCDGDKLKTCIDGSWKTIDCTSLGLGKCEVPAQATRGANCSGGPG